MKTARPLPDGPPDECILWPVHKSRAGPATWTYPPAGRHSHVPGTGGANPAVRLLPETGVPGMVVLRLGPEVRRWAAVVAGAGLLIGVLRWGFHGMGQDIATGAPSNTEGQMAVAERVVALTVDATSADRIEPVVQALAAANLPGTFFVDAAYAKAHAADLRKLVQAGYEIEVLLAPGDVGSQVQAVGTAADAPPLFVRPATGSGGAALSTAARNAGVAVSLPSVTAPDGTPTLHPGDVVLLPAGTAGAAAVNAIAQEMTAGGYQGVTLEDLAAIADGAAAVSMN